MQPIVKESAKLTLNAVQSCGVLLGRAVGLIDFPVPQNSAMRKTGGTTVRSYYSTGVSCYLPIATVALQVGIRLRENINILDFGCGVGRQLLQFTRNFPAPAYFACDVNYDAIGFVARNYPSVVSRTNKFDPPLPFEADSMDMVYSVSTFSHINPEHQGDWLKEMFRVTRPGGYCFLTTEGWTALKQLALEFPLEAAERELRAKGILYKEYDYYGAVKSRKSLSPAVDLLVGIDKSYGSTVMTPEFIFKKWSQVGFTVVAVVEGIINYRQDLIVLHKAS